MKNTLDADGDLAQVQSKENIGDFFRNYAGNFVYTAAGAVSSLRLGNGKFENTQYNSRLQPVQIGLGASASTQNLLKLNFDYGTTANNGNVKSQMITIPTVGASQGFAATQNYSYDSLNRIKQAVETIPSQTGWQQAFIYDRYGNRRFDTANNATTTLMPNCPVAVCNPEINPTNNRLIGYGFDSSGNTSQDANDQTFIYDAENKQVQVNNVNGIVGQYFYNGDGQRVKKVVPNTGETTVFVYDASNKLVAEYSTMVASATIAKISYLTNDHLGSPRITTDALGQVISRRDFMPFGEEITRANYGSDSVRQKFTTYERDNETELDFAEARYYNNSLGRFTSVDPLMASADVEIPQSWNRYVYVMNNPLVFIDPTGMIWVRSGADTFWFTDEEWKTKSQMVDGDGKSIYRVLDASEFEFDSVDGRVSLDANGPTELNPNGFNIIGPNVGSGAGVMAGTAIVISQVDSPAPGPADILALFFLAAAGYQALTHETLQKPIMPPFLMSTKDEQKSNPDKVAVAGEAIEALSGALDKLKSTPNKTPEIKKQIETIKKAIKKAKDAMKKSEPHGIKGKRN